MNTQGSGAKKTGPVDEDFEGGPAFPCQDSDGDCIEGMTVRDYFAGQALASIDAMRWDDLSDRPMFMATQIAQRAFEIAQAMLKERDEGQ